MANNTIWKYELTPGEQMILMPVGAKVLHVAIQHNTVCMWAEVDSNPTAEKEDRSFKVCGTGFSENFTNWNYIGTVLMAGGTLVWHVYEWSKRTDMEILKEYVEKNVGLDGPSLNEVRGNDGN